MNKDTISWENNFGYTYTQVPESGIQHVILDKDLKPVCNPFFCKEYFQDIIWAEKTGKTEVIQHGLRYKTQNLLKEFSVAIRWLPGYLHKEAKLNIENIKAIISQLEDSLGIKERCKIEQLTNAILLYPSEKWIENPISSSILLQSLRHAKEFDEKKDVINNLKDGSWDNNYLAQIGGNYQEKLSMLMKGNIFDYEWNNFPNSNQAHNSGLRNVDVTKLKK